MFIQPTWFSAGQAINVSSILPSLWEMLSVLRMFVCRVFLLPLLNLQINLSNGTIRQWIPSLKLNRTFYLSFHFSTSLVACIPDWLFMVNTMDPLACIFSPRIHWVILVTISFGSVYKPYIIHKTSLSFLLFVFFLLRIHTCRIITFKKHVTFLDLVLSLVD